MPRHLSRDNLRAATLTKTQWKKVPFRFLPISFSLSPYGQHELLSFLAPSCRRRPNADLPPPFLLFYFSATAENGISYASIYPLVLSLSLSLSLSLIIFPVG